MMDAMVGINGGLPDNSALAQSNRTTVIWSVVLATFTLVLYAPTLNGMVADWWSDPDYTYGFLVPLVVGYVMWLERFRYNTVAIKPSGVGLAIMVGAVAVLIGGTLGADSFTPRFSLCLLLAGMVVYLWGWRMLRALAFPLCYLSLMIPLPNLFQSQITFPLQLLASRTAEHLIALTRIPVFREGNLLQVPFYKVEVAQACSGIRSLLSLISLGVAYSYFAETRTWIRTALVVLVVPIAILTNAIRIVASCLIGYKFGPEWAEGFLHLFSGWLIFLGALSLLFLSHTLLCRIADLCHGRGTNA